MSCDKSLEHARGHLAHFNSQKGSGPPFVGDMHGAGVKDDGLGCLAGDLVRARLLEEVAHHFPEQRPIRVPLLEVKRSRPCATCTTFTCAGTFSHVQ